MTMASTRTHQEIGRSNRRSGKAWQLACAAKLRTLSYPNAAYEIRNGASDILGTGDVAVECTVTTWEKIWIKLDQARRDGQRRGLDIYCVWKKRNGTTDPGDGAIVMPAGLFWPLMADLEAYQRAEAGAQLDYDRGYAAGFRAGSKGETG
jgi:hypothetical protein